MAWRVAPCGWEPAYCLQGAGPTCTSLSTLDEDTADLVVQAAVEYLWKWSGRKYGTCEITVRPCRRDCAQPSTYRGPRWSSQLPWIGGGPAWLSPAVIDGAWHNLPCGGGCGDRCSCATVDTVRLAGPVASITEVIIGGVVLDPQLYRVDNHTDLIRLDGGAWPWCSDQVSALTEAGTFGVTYEMGIPVPAGGRLAAGVLACQMAQWICGQTRCGPPSNARSVTRQGVSVELLPSLDTMFTTGTTGLIAVDMWLASESPKGKTGGRVYSPDLRPVRRTTTPPAPPPPPPHFVTVGLVTESGEVFPADPVLVPPQIVGVGLVTETGETLAVTADLSSDMDLVTETGEVFPAGHSLSVTLGLVTGTGTTYALVIPPDGEYRVVPLGLWAADTETDVGAWPASEGFEVPYTQEQWKQHVRGNMLAIQQFFYDRCAGWTFEWDDPVIYVSELTAAEMLADPDYGSNWEFVEHMMLDAEAALPEVNLSDVTTMYATAAPVRASAVATTNLGQAFGFGPPTGFDPFNPVVNPMGCCVWGDRTATQRYGALFGSLRPTGASSTDINLPKTMMAHEMGHMLGWNSGTGNMLPHDDASGLENIMRTLLPQSGSLRFATMTPAQVALCQASPFMTFHASRPVSKVVPALVTGTGEVFPVTVRTSYPLGLVTEIGETLGIPGGIARFVWPWVWYAADGEDDPTIWTGPPAGDPPFALGTFATNVTANFHYVRQWFWDNFDGYTFVSTSATASVFGDTNADLQTVYPGPALIHEGAYDLDQSEGSVDLTLTSRIHFIITPLDNPAIQYGPMLGNTEFIRDFPDYGIAENLPAVPFAWGVLPGQGLFAGNGQVTLTGSTVTVDYDDGRPTREIYQPDQDLSCGMIAHQIGRILGYASGHLYPVVPDGYVIPADKYDLMSDIVHHLQAMAPNTATVAAFKNSPFMTYHPVRP